MTKEKRAEWPFADPPNVITFTTKQILAGDWVEYVSHDADDGSWQFHHQESTGLTSDGRIVGLECMLEMEPAIAELADLPCGWCAWRDSKTSPWKRAPKPANPNEDATPPPETSA